MIVLRFISAFVLIFTLTFLVTFGLKDINVTPVELILCSEFSIFLVLEVYILHLFENHVKHHSYSKIHIQSFRVFLLTIIVIIAFILDYLLELKFGENWKSLPFYWLWAYPVSYFFYYLTRVDNGIEPNVPFD